MRDYILEGYQRWIERKLSLLRLKEYLSLFKVHGSLNLAREILYATEKVLPLISEDNIVFFDVANENQKGKVFAIMKTNAWFSSSIDFFIGESKSKSELKKVSIEAFFNNVARSHFCTILDEKVETALQEQEYLLNGSKLLPQLF